jgi:acetyltransferase
LVRFGNGFRHASHAAGVAMRLHPGRRGLAHILLSHVDHHLALSTMTDIRELDAGGVEAILPELAELLIDAVEDDASIGFLAPLSVDEARAYWHGVADAVAHGSRVMLVADREGLLAGTVQLDLCQKANGVNRAEVQKLLVHTRARRGGVAGSLMREAEAQALALRRGLLYLDTLAGSDAEYFYQSFGYQRLGELPDYAATPSGEWRPTAIYYKVLFTPQSLPRSAARNA